ncbi:MAG TPA: CHAT domain-containing protein [Leeuwenhoekiella sp.]|nr:CHAT domain-containing protein [Leeuwenhoekiella sp.]
MRFFVFFIVLLINHMLVAQETYEDQVGDLFDKANVYAYKNKDSSDFYHQKVLELTQKNKDWNYSIWTLMSWNHSSASFYDLQQMSKNIKSLDSLFHDYKSEINEIPEKSIYINSLNYEKGIYQYQLGNYRESRDSFENIIELVEKTPDSLIDPNDLDSLIAAYSFTAKMFTNEGKYQLAKSYYTKNIRLLKEKKPGDTSSLYRNYSLLGEVFKNEKEYEASNRYFVPSINFNLKHKEDTKTILTEADHLIDNYINLSKADSATYYLKIMNENLSPDNPFLHKYHQAKARLLKFQHENQEALLEYRQALAALKMKWGHQKQEEIGILYREMGDLCVDLNRPEQAMVYYDLSVDQYKQNKAKITLVQTYMQQTKVFNTLATKNSFKNTLETVDLGIRALDRLKPAFSSTSDKLSLIADTFPLFEAGLESTFALTKIEKNSALMGKAFFYMEKSKAALLLEAFLNSQANQFAGLPTQLLEKEQQLQAEITKLENQIARKQYTDVALDDALFNLKREYRNLIEAYEHDYPAYYNLRHDTRVITLQEVQEKLKDGELLLSYFYGSHAIYALAIKNDNVKFEQIKLDAYLENHINHTVQLLHDPKSDNQALAKISFRLYMRLLKPLISGEKIKQITILADGPLNYLPFGGMNIAADKVTYLIEKMPVSYASSATLLSQLNKQEQFNQSILAFAPEFNSALGNPKAQAAALLPLPNSKKEVDGIVNYFSGTSFTGTSATLENFKDQCATHGIIHLATHAVVDNQSPENSYLAFSPLSGKDFLLYTRDLYTMHIPADLVTLSACDTGLGELKRGEGFISLARAFYYSGAKSLVNTLWSNNDQSTTAIMTQFYGNLADGMPKNEALREAKLTFLKAHKEDKLAHPYYWSAFVVSGNVAPLTTPYNFWLIFGLTALILTLCALIFNRKREIFPFLIPAGKNLK